MNIYMRGVLKIDTTCTLNIKSANDIHCLDDLGVYKYPQFVRQLQIIYKVLGESYEHSRYSVEYKLLSLYQDFDSTFYTA